MRIRLYTETVVDGAHRLEGYRGACAGLHGHSWKISLWVEGDSTQVDEVGILFDFGRVKDIKDLLDHKCLNDVEGFSKKNPTAENITQFLYSFLKELCPHLDFCVRVYETYVGKTTYCQVGDFVVEGMS